MKTERFLNKNCFTSGSTESRNSTNINWIHKFSNLILYMMRCYTMLYGHVPIYYEHSMLDRNACAIVFYYQQQKFSFIHEIRFL